MLDSLSRAVFQMLAGNRQLQALASKVGMREPGGFARRFIAGETAGEAIAVARTLEARGLAQTLDYLGESASTMADADAAARACLALIEQVAASGIGRNLSVKLTQLGLSVDRATCVDNLRRVLDAGGRHEFFVRIDMEQASLTAVTLDIFQTIWQQGYRNAGVVLQSYLPRSLDDAKAMNALGARVRLVKGAYKEPKAVAYQAKSDVDRAFVEIMKVLLAGGTAPAIATHDPAMIDATRSFARAQGIDASRYEFQMLYGIRRDLQQTLRRDGERVRIYVPFGREWFPYFMRRLGERPANVGFVFRSLLRER